MIRLTCFLQETLSLHYEDVDIFFLKELSICKISNNWQNLARFGGSFLPGTPTLTQRSYLFLLGAAIHIWKVKEHSK